VNLLKSKLRRTTAVLAGAMLGLSGAAFFAAPASAHSSYVSGTAECDTTTGEWAVKWTVDTDNGRTKHSKSYRFVYVDSQVDGKPAANAVEGIAHTPDDANPPFPYESNKPLEGTQRVAGDAKEASLTVQVKWSDEFTEWDKKTGTVQLGGSCTKDAPKPDAHLASSCDEATVTLANGKDAKLAAEFTIKNDGKLVKEVVIKAGGEPVNVTIPAKEAGTIVVTEKHSDKPILQGKWEKPKDCAPDESKGGFQATCDSLIFGIDNTEGRKTVTLTLTPNKGEAKTLTVKAGEKGEVTFKGVKGLEVTPTEDGVEYESVSWDKEKPKDCDASASPSPSTPGEGGGGGLPVTGAAAGGIASGAGVLLAIGAVLFFMARRRKVKFTA
jgi:hypothetical protein